jgi:integrase/recombinase XerD
MKRKDKLANVTFEPGYFSTLFEQFVRYKQGLGYTYGYRIQKTLATLNCRLNLLDTGSPVLTRETVEYLAAHHSNEAPATQVKRAALLRHFAEFMVDMGYEAYVYPLHCSRITYDTFAPFIFTREQIIDIIHVSDTLPLSACSPRYHIVWPAFMRVLYCCGLRLSEALQLRAENVDIDKGTLYIEKSKKGTSRYVPVSSSLHDYLEMYIRKVGLFENEDIYLFPAPDGGPYSQNTAYERVKSFYVKAGIPRLSNGRLPRVHDVRHTYCCHALEKMQQKGFDLYYSLPILSTYLGHQGIRETERYLHLSQFHYEELSSIPELTRIIPEVDC